MLSAAEGTPPAHPAAQAQRTPERTPERPRFQGFVEVELGHDGRMLPPRILCPSGGHYLRPDNPLTESGFLDCGYREPLGPGRSGPACDRRVWLYLSPRRVKGAPPDLYVAEVDWREAQYMEQQMMDVPEIRRFLGAPMYAPPKLETADQRRRRGGQ